MAIKTNHALSLSDTLKPYAQSDDRKAVLQLVTTVIPYMLVWVAMVLIINRGLSYFYVIPLVILSGLFLVRIFIFFHDMGHNSFFTTKRANRIVGAILGLTTFTPYLEWQHSHNVHHATAGNLDKRGVGDVETMTVVEYKQAKWTKRITYRLMRNWFVLLVLGPIFNFVVFPRFPKKAMKPELRRGVWMMNLAIVIELFVAYFTIGLPTFLLIKLPMMQVAGAFGIFLFFVQHQFQGVYWERSEDWDRQEAALKGCSYLRLPKILQWFSGNIGFHHIHHLRSRIPNYNLERCYREVAVVQQPIILNGWQALACLKLQLYDEQKQQMVSFRDARLAAS